MNFEQGVDNVMNFVKTELNFSFLTPFVSIEFLKTFALHPIKQSFKNSFRLLIKIFLAIARLMNH